MRSLSVEKAVKSENQNGRKRRGVAKKRISLLVLAVIVMAFLASCGSSASLKNAKIGSYITFGHYEQDGDTSNGEEAIEWLVLDKQGDKILVVSKYVLEERRYNSEYEEITWETCSLRTWLNGTFYNSAFSSEEKAKIPTVTVSTEDNPYYGTSGGKDTQDKVFVLSISEVNMYFSSDNSPECTGTDLLIIREAGEVYDTAMMNEYRQTVLRWWLRTRGKYRNSATQFKRSVDIGDTVNCRVDSTSGVRPAMWIDLGA